MNAFNPKATEMYRQSTKAQLWLDHRRKHCACGKVITAKQLQQYGACSACVKDKHHPTDTESAPAAQSGSDVGQGGV